MQGPLVVTIKLNGRIIGTTRANARGQFRKQVRVPSDAEGSDEVSARCHGKFVGVKIIIIVIIYPTQQSLVSADRTAVPAGQTVTLRGTSCPTGNPTASLDGQQVNLNVDRSAKRKGFKATATIPASVSPGRHTLWAGCDAGSAGTTQLQVLEGSEPAAAKMEMGAQPPSSLALWFGLFSGIAVLVASVAITWKAMGQAKLVAQDLTTARALLTRAGGFETGKLKQRLALIDQAEEHTVAAEQRLNRWSLRQLGVLPLVGRDIRVARAVATSATGTTKATRGVVSALQPLPTKAPTGASIQKAADALLNLHGSLEQDLETTAPTRACPCPRRSRPATSATPSGGTGRR